MKESHDEGLAIHIGPESCAGIRKGIGEALTGESAGWVLSPEIKVSIPGADGLLMHGRQHRVSRHGEVYTDSAGSETPCMHGNSLRGNREALCLALEDRAKVRTVNPEGERL